MIQVVGIGPGKRDGRTIAADDALRRADAIVGFTTYVALVRDEFADKQFVTTGMRGEKERCAQALALSRAGKRVALICSGDAQVYGMASLLLEMAEDGDEIEVVPGVFAHSDFVLKAVGCGCVCERAAVLNSGGRLLVGKTAMEGVTFALAGEENV